MSLIGDLDSFPSLNEDRWLFYFFDYVLSKDLKDAPLIRLHKLFFYILRRFNELKRKGYTKKNYVRRIARRNAI